MDVEHLPPIPAPPPVEPSPSTRRRTGLVIGAIVAAVALIAAVGVFALTQGDRAEAQPLAFSFTEGDRQTYEISQTMDAQIGSDTLGDQPMSMDITQVVGWEVISVAEDGTATIQVTVSDMSGTVNGMQIPSTPAPPIDIVIAPDGRIVSAGGLALGGAGQTQGFGFPGMGQLTPILPDEGQEVAVGDTWDKDFSQEFPFGDGTIDFTSSSTYVRDETLDGRQAAVVVTDLTVPMNFTLSFADLLEALGPEIAGATGPDPALFEDARIAYGGQGTVTQTSWLDLQAQELLRSESSGTFDLTMAFTGIPGLGEAGPAEVAFSGTFTQELKVS